MGALFDTFDISLPGDIIYREKMGATFHTSDISPPGDFSDVSNFAPRRYLLGEASFQDTGNLATTILQGSVDAKRKMEDQAPLG